MSAGKVDIYYNVHKNKLSVRSREKENYGRVIRHTDLVILKDVSFVVSEAGRQRVLREQRKNVHAVVRGILIDEKSGREKIKENLDQGVIVTYNPYRYEKFWNLNENEAINQAEFVIISGKDILAIPRAV